MSSNSRISKDEISNLKFAAKRLKRKLGVSHSEALDQVAREKGFNARSHPQHLLNSLTGSIIFRATLEWPSTKLKASLEKNARCVRKNHDGH